jgi:DNA-binding protein HU-beta
VFAVYAKCFLHGDSALRIAGQFKENSTMNRTETIHTMAMSADISKAAAERVIDAFEARLKAHTDAGKRVVFRGFGSFSRGLPSQKVGRNPQTGQPLTYTAYHKPKNAPSVAEADLCREVAADAQVSEAAASRALDAFQAAIVTSLHKGDVVSFYGFGQFYVGRRAARNGRNPRTGAAILIPAAHVPRFKASKAGNVGAKFSAGSSLKAALR